MSVRFVDLFSGAGGLSKGLCDAGFELVYANEIDNSFCETFDKNHNVRIIDNRDINIINIKKDFQKFSKIDLIVGGPPCQGFSQKGSRKGILDDRNFLFKKFVEFVEILKPQVFLMENVPNLLTSNNGFFFKEINKYFNNMGYQVSSKVMNCFDYGIPQTRRRAIIIGNLLSKEFEFPKKIKKVVSVHEAISDLPRLLSGEGDTFQEYVKSSSSDYQKIMRKGSKGIYNHVSTKHSPEALERLSLIPPFGGKSDLPSQLRTKSIYSGTWGRIDPNGPARTITTRFDTPSSGQFTLNDQDRCLTVREAARIQSFPDNFIFYGNKTSQMKQVGNAVPPLLAKQIGQKILELF